MNKTAFIALSCLTLSSNHLLAHGSNAGHSHGHGHGSNCNHPGCHHDHGAHSKAKNSKIGPKKGRLIKGISPTAEVVVRSDRKVQVYFYNSQMKRVRPSSQIVTLSTGGTDAVELSFKKKGRTLISTTALPAGKEFSATVSIKAHAKAKPVSEKFDIKFK